MVIGEASVLAKPHPPVDSEYPTQDDSAKQVNADRQRPEECDELDHGRLWHLPKAPGVPLRRRLLLGWLLP